MGTNTNYPFQSHRKNSMNKLKIKSRRLRPRWHIRLMPIQIEQSSQQWDAKLSSSLRRRVKLGRARSSVLLVLAVVEGGPEGHLSGSQGHQRVAETEQRPTVEGRRERRRRRGNGNRRIVDNCKRTKKMRLKPAEKRPSKEKQFETKISPSARGRKFPVDRSSGSTCSTTAAKATPSGPTQ
jgi:hypothetical protein